MWHCGVDMITTGLAASCVGRNVSLDNFDLRSESDNNAIVRLRSDGCAFGFLSFFEASVTPRGSPHIDHPLAIANSKDA